MGISLSAVVLALQVTATPLAGGGRAALALDDQGDPQRWLAPLLPDYLEPPAKGAVAHPLYLLPLATRPGYALERADTGYVDLDPAFPNQLLDYECLDRTYDLASGYNHQGVDYGLWPYWWYQMDRETTQVIAAAAGTIVFKEDGHFDRQCTFNAEVPNFVGVQHADGSIALYFHLKRGSLTAKPIGAAVAPGELLGLVGSSGSSVLPHLHLETYYPGTPNQIVEPHAGPCRPGDSWWLAQEPYLRPAMVRIATHDVAPSPANVFLTCEMGLVQDPHYRDFFAPNEPLYFAIYFRDASNGDVVDVTVRDPDGNEAMSFQHLIDADLKIGWWSWGPWQFAAKGRFRAIVGYRGVDTVHTFFVGPTVFASGFE